MTGAGSGAGGRAPQRRLRRGLSLASPQPTRRARHGATRRRRRGGDRSGSAVTGVWCRRRIRSVWLRDSALSRRGPSGRAAARASARAAAAPHGWRAHCGARVQGRDRRRVCGEAEAAAVAAAVGAAAAAAAAAEAAARPGAIMLGESCEHLRAQTIPKPHTAASASASAAAAASASAEGLWETAKALLRRRRVRGTDIGQMKSRRARTGRAAEAKGGQARAEASSDEGVAKLGYPRRRGHASWASGAATAAAAATATSATSAAAASATSAAALAAGKAPAAAVGGSPRRVRSPKLLCGEVGGASW